MDFRTHVTPDGHAATVRADALLLVVCGEPGTARLEPLLAKALAKAVKQGDFAHKAGSCVALGEVAGVKSPRLVLAAAADAAPKAVKAAIASGLAAVRNLGVEHLAVCIASGRDLSEAHAEALATACGDAAYVYRRTKPSAPAAPRLQRVSLLVDKSGAAAARVGLKRGAAIVSGVNLARELANRPANHCTPSMLAEEARALAKSQGMRIEVLDHKAAQRLGMGSFLAVAQGSEQPPRFIVVHYQGAGKSDAPLVLVGKGITFDTGGISIKPSAEMDEMKFDMSGAASVLGTLAAVSELKAKVNLIGLIPACENMPGGRAVKPGDVVTSLSGQTIEILNTDAEGRLILCDALTYAERFKPAAVVDIATLTGACVIALGHQRSGLFAPDDELAQELLDAGAAALDPCWRMPLDEEYDEVLKSNFADMANVGPRAGGAINAAMFLKRFTKKLNWAHLDIAGTAWRSGSAKGATGRPVGLLTHWILGRS